MSSLYPKAYEEQKVELISCKTNVKVADIFIKSIKRRDIY